MAKKDVHHKGRSETTPAYNLTIKKPKDHNTEYSHKGMEKFKKALQEHKADQTLQARGEAVMQFVSELANEIIPLRFKRLTDLNEKRDTKLTLNDLKNSALEQPIEKCIREFCVVANSISKSQKPEVKKGAGSIAEYSDSSVRDLEYLKTRFINEIAKLKPEADEPSKIINTTQTKADKQYSKSLYTVAINVITKHHLTQSESLPTPPTGPGLK